MRSLMVGLVAAVATSVSLPLAVPAGAAGMAQQIVEMKGATTGGKFGASVAIAGDELVVGATGYDPYGGTAYLFTKTTGAWKETVQLRAPGVTSHDLFGGAVALASSFVVVGAPYAASTGRAYVFAKTALGWRQTAELKGSDTGAAASLGSSVAASGTTIVIGAPWHGSGRAYVFAKTAAGWRQTAELTGSGATRNGDEFGSAVSISGATIAVGALGADRAYLFAKTTTGWRQTAELSDPGTHAGNYFGASIALSPAPGDEVVVGDPTFAGWTGRAYVFARTATGWHRAAELEGTGTGQLDEFGGSVALSGNSAVIGASGASRAYVFSHTTNGWRQSAVLKGGDTVFGDWFGVSVAASGTAIVVGAQLANRAYVFSSGEPEG